MIQQGTKHVVIHSFIIYSSDIIDLGTIYELNDEIYPHTKNLTASQRPTTKVIQIALPTTTANWQL